MSQSGQDCYNAIVKMDAKALGASLNLNMKCWETLLPLTVRHPLIKVDLMGLLKAYQQQYLGAMYLGLRWRISDRCFQRAGARRLQGQGSHCLQMSSSKQVIVSGGFDDIKSRDLRFLEEAAKLGELTVLLWPDATLQELSGKAPKFTQAERLYFLNAVRYVSRVVEANETAGFDTLPDNLRPDVWADYAVTTNPARERFAAENKIAYRVFTADELKGFPEPPPMPSAPGQKESGGHGLL